MIWGFLWLKGENCSKSYVKYFDFCFTKASVTVMYKGFGCTRAGKSVKVT